jgi:murein DD-endopeptidase MepM/ murein hydrolase activator NlpD
MDNGNRRNKTLSIPVKAGKFTVSRLKVDPDRVHPSEEELKRIQKEKEEVAAAYASPSPTPLWQDKFAFPAKDVVTDRFGNKRTFNGQVKSVHLGVDLRASIGTPILAANTGKVVLAKEMFYGGNTVILDHGGGLFSNYGHMSALKVTPGQTVKAGDMIGAAGATGRVTGPHLHWGTRVNGTPVDPRVFLTTFNHLWEKN